MKRIVLPTAILLILGVLALWFLGRPAYRHHRETNALAQARKYLAGGDLPNASLSARQVLRLNAQNLEACEIMAQLAESVGAPQSLDWRRRVAEISPTAANKLKLAASALAVQAAPYPLASQILQELAEPAKDLPVFHVLSAELALKLNIIAEAEAQFLEAGRLEPGNPLHRLNLAVLRLRSTNDTFAAEARDTLERLAVQTNLAAIALRSLVGDSLARKDLTAADAFSRRLLADPRCIFEDRLRHLAILQEAKSPEFDSFLAAIQQQACTNAAQIYAASGWMLAHGLVGQATAWLTNVPPWMQAEQPVRLAWVNACATRNDWAGLETYLQDQKWGDLEFLRLAWLSRAASEQKNGFAADAQWRLALRQAGDRYGALSSLLNLARNWDRDKATEELLWVILQKFPQEKWTWQELTRLYTSTGNTRGLNKLYSAMAARDPADRIANNNFAVTCFLLKLNLSKAHQIAKELYAAHSEEPIIASTYAFSLHLQNRTHDGLAVLQKLAPTALENPAVSMYYGVLLNAAGQTNQAVRYLAVARQSKLLPEEEVLVAAAQHP